MRVLMVVCALDAAQGVFVGLFLIGGAVVIWNAPVLAGHGPASAKVAHDGREIGAAYFALAGVFLLLIGLAYLWWLVRMERHANDGKWG